MTGTLAVGDTAPDFTLATDEGSVQLAQLKGKKVVVYFYPKDDTSGCTKQAIEFTQAKQNFADAGTEVIGLSADSTKSHANFRKKHQLNFALGSDESKTTLEAYGVWVEKSMYGKKYMGIERTTFLIDAAGKIAAIWPKVKVDGHVAEVLKAAQKL